MKFLKLNKYRFLFYVASFTAICIGSSFSFSADAINKEQSTETDGIIKKAPSFEICDDENSYLEKNLPKYNYPELSCKISEYSVPMDFYNNPDNSHRIIGFMASLPKACLHASMKQADEQITGPRAKTEGYRWCEKDVFGKTHYYRGLKRPCISEAYVDYVYKMFMQAATCFNISPRELFPKTNLEGEFIFNRYGIFEAIGYSQLTSAPIKQVQINSQKNFKPELGFDFYKSKKECQVFLPFLRKPEMDTNKREHRKFKCDALGSHNAFLFQLTYTSLYYKYLRHNVENLFNKKLKASFNKECDFENESQDVQCNKIKQALRIGTFLSWNTGNSGFDIINTAFIKEINATKNLDQFSPKRFYDKLQKALINAKKSNGEALYDSNRASYLNNYIPNMVGKLNTIEQLNTDYDGSPLDCSSLNDVLE